MSMGNMHLGALELSLTADNWSAGVTVRSAIDGRIINAGAKLYRKFNNKHIEPMTGEVVGDDGVCLLVRSCQANIYVAQAARTRALQGG
ncbi:MAG: trehalose/maltose hydrolase-like predicted phosphorylase [Rhodoferax sp.]